MRVGRNDPCPCGSGKKYKKCCYLSEKTVTPVLTHQLLRRTADKAADLLLRHARKLYGTNSIEDAWTEFWGSEDHEEIDLDTYIGLFLPWFTYYWHPGEHLLDEKNRDSEENTVIARFLAERSSRLDPFEVRFLESVRKEPLSFWQVEAVEPGKGMLLKDLAIERECFVYDRSSTKTITKWDLILGQVVGLDGEYILSSLGPYPLPGGRFRKDIEDFIDHIRVERSLDPVDLREYANQFIGFYHDCVDLLLHPIFPTIRNSDGEEIVFVKSLYSFHADHRDEIIEKMKKLRNVDFCGDEEGGLEFNWIAKQKKGMSHGMIRGSITVGPEHLRTECNSEKRDKKLSDKLHKHLGQWITHEDTSYKELDLDELEREPQSESTLDLAKLTEDSRRDLVDHIEQQYLNWADEKIPALDHQTPREAVMTSGGKARVTDLINDWENMQLRNNHTQFPFDFNKLRSELGIENE